MCVPIAHDRPFDFCFYYDNGNRVNKNNNRSGDGSVGETFNVLIIRTKKKKKTQVQHVRVVVELR